MANLTTLVTGGTSGLGRATAEGLRAAGRDVRVLSREQGPGTVVGDLSTGAGLAEALDGVGTVVHLATTRSAKDSAQTRLLLDAAARARVGHLVFISIVGVDLIPFAYYADKVLSEKMIEESGIPFTILRATQFHSFVAEFLRPQRLVVVSLDVPVQPIASEEVARRLVELANGSPAGRVPDIGGPEHLTVRQAVDAWQDAHGTHRPVATMPVPGKTIRAFKAGHHLTPLPGYGTETFAEYAAREAQL